VRTLKHFYPNDPWESFFFVPNLKAYSSEGDVLDLIWSLLNSKLKPLQELFFSWEELAPQIGIDFMSESEKEYPFQRKCFKSKYIKKGDASFFRSPLRSDWKNCNDRCPRHAHFSTSLGANQGPPSHSSITTRLRYREGLRALLNWVPIMLRDPSFSDGCTAWTL